MNDEKPICSSPREIGERQAKDNHGSGTEAAAKADAGSAKASLSPNMSEKAKGQWTTGEPGYLPGNSPVGRNWIVAVLDSGKSRVATAQAESKEEVEKVSRLIAAAPDLYFWAKELLVALPTNRDWLNPDIERNLRAAIKSVEGQ